MSAKYQKPACWSRRQSYRPGEPMKSLCELAAAIKRQDPIFVKFNEASAVQRSHMVIQNMTLQTLMGFIAQGRLLRAEEKA